MKLFVVLSQLILAWVVPFSNLIALCTASLLLGATTEFDKQKTGDVGSERAQSIRDIGPWGTFADEVACWAGTHPAKSDGSINYALYLFVSVNRVEIGENKKPVPMLSLYSGAGFSRFQNINVYVGDQMYEWRTVDGVTAYPVLADEPQLFSSFLKTKKISITYYDKNGVGFDNTGHLMWLNYAYKYILEVCGYSNKEI